MAKNGPVILIDDDADEGEFLTDVFKRLAIENTLHCFTTGEDALHYLRTTTEKPFVILCDVNMPLLNGLEVRQEIERDEFLRTKSIPFVFYTTSATKPAVDEAYLLSVQGFFEKGHSTESISKLMQTIFDYWTLCRHPNE